MKKLLLFIITALSLSSNSFAQLIEVSLKAGVCMNGISHKFENISNFTAKGNLGYASGISGTIKLGGFRAGLSISALKVSATLHNMFSWPTNEPKTINHSLGNPLIPVEAMFLKRIDLSKLSLDFGVLGGVCVNNRYVNSYEDGTPTTKHNANTTWCTYGGIFSSQYAISKRIAVGVEVQMKWLRLKRGQVLDNTILLPVMAKISARI